MIKESPLIDLYVPLYTKDGPNWEVVKIPIVGINQMYSGGKAMWKRGKRLTKEAVLYKKHLEKCIREYMLLNKLEADIEWPVFYILNINLCIPKSKNGEFNKAYYRDLDGLLKPIQDELSSKIKQNDIRIWRDDKQVVSFFANLNYVDLVEQGSIHIKVYNYTDNIKNVLSLF